MIFKSLLWIARIIFGGVFIFAGFTKAIDPLGSAYKFEDYFIAFNMEWLFPLALPLAFLLNAIELLLGVAILLGLKLKISAWLGLLFMAFFAPLTLYIALTDPVPDCGCFGDAIIISNWDTFYKNVVLLAAVVLIFGYRKAIPPLWSERKDWILIAGSFAFICGLSFYCLRNLPIIDFRPWKVGNDMFEKLQPLQEEESEMLFVYRNKETGEKKGFVLEDIPASAAPWEFVERDRLVLQEYVASPIENFYIQNELDWDYTEEILKYRRYQFWVISYDLNRTNIKAFRNKVSMIAEYAKKYNIPIIGLTSSSFADIDGFVEMHNINFPIYQSDERELKTIVRSNPGLLLIHNGVVMRKWHYRNIPEYDDIFLRKK